jgi:DNA-binding NarL/FixJ family response regulator
VGDAQNECRALVGLGTVHHDRNEYEPALEFHNEALNLARSLGDARSIAITLGNLGAVSFYLGKSEEAIRYWEESRGYLIETGDKMAEAICLMNLGALSFQMGSYAQAEKYQTYALRLQRQMSVQRDIPFTLINLSETALMLGDHTLAHDAIAEAIARLQELGTAEVLGVALNGRARIAFVEGHDAETAAFVLESMQQLLDLENRLPIIENGELMGELCARRGMPGIALELIHAAALMRERYGVQAYDVRRRTMDDIRQQTSEALDTVACDAAIRAAESLDDDSLARRISSVARDIAGRRHQVAGAGPNERAMPGRTDVPPAHNLTAREIEVLSLLAQGHSTQEIADQLFVSPRTAATHINNIIGKLEVNSRTAAVAYAMRIGLV